MERGLSPRKDEGSLKGAAEHTIVLSQGAPQPHAEGVMFTVVLVDDVLDAFAVPPAMFA